MDFCLELAALSWQRYYIILFPEDRGLAERGTPASLWTRPLACKLAALRGYRTGAFYHCDFDQDAVAPKPTRIATNLDVLMSRVYLMVVAI